MIGLCLGVLLLLLLLGNTFSVTDFLLIGVVGVVMSEVLFIGQEPRQLMLWLGDSLKDSWPFLSQLLLFLLVICLTDDYLKMPSEVFVRQVQALVNKLGVMVLVAISIHSLVTAMITMVTSGVFPEQKHFLLVLKVYALWLASLWLIGEFGDQVYRSLLSNPYEPAAFLTAAIILAAVIKVPMMMYHSPSNATHQQAAQVGVARAAFPRLTAEDRERTAVHECSHALIFAALPSLPEDLGVVVNDRPVRGRLGYVGSSAVKSMVDTRQEAEWRMLLDLAGNAGELAFFGESSLGSRTDYEHWHFMAREYLANNERGLYFPNPCNAFEQAHNARKLEQLESDQKALLAEFFRQNMEVLKALVTRLIEERGRMDCKELKPFLDRVVLPEGFPVPLSRTGFLASNGASGTS